MKYLIKCLGNVSWHEKLKTINRVMKLSFVLCIATMLNIFASSYSQTARVSLSLHDVKIEDVLDKIEEQSEFYFLYNQKLVDLSKKVSIDVHNKPINEVLNALLDKGKVDYVVYDRQIIVTPVGTISPTDVAQQGITITGTVTDATGTPMPGVNVMVQGTNTGVASDVNGKYTITVSNENAVLTFSFVGYTTYEQTVGPNRVMNVTLTEDLREIEEVVVVGYGTQKKKDVTGSVASVDNSMITKQNAVNTTTALRGQIAGLSVQQNNGRAGGETTVILRGQSAIGKTVQPLVIIDGIPSGWGVLNDMSPDDIERIDVLKDASSTAIYGSRASGGVIIVTTRAGRETKNVVSYRGSVGIKKLTNNPEMMNTPQFYQFYQDGVAFRGEPQDNKIMSDDQKYIDEGINTDWLDFILRDGMQTSHNLSLSGGGKNETHYMSLGYYKENGIQKSEEYERFSLNARISGRVIDKLTAGASVYASYAVNDRGGQDMLNSAYRLRPWGNPYNDDGSYRFFPTQNESAFVNPVFDLENTYWQQKRLRARGSAFLEYKPIDGLSVKSTFMPTFSMTREGNYVGEMTRANVGKAGTSRADATNKWDTGYLWENVIAYNKRIKDHSIGFTGLFSMEDGFNEEYVGKVQGLTYPDEYWYNLGASASTTGLTSKYTDQAMISYMGRINYGFKDKYLFTVTGRWDGSSKLAEGNQWGFFPSAAFAWRAGEEEFIKNLDVFSNLKLRLSYGVAGNNAVDPYSSFATLSTVFYAWDETSAKGSAAKMANRGLGWEKSYEYNLGFDLGFFNERLTAAIDLYHKTTKNLILDRKIPSHQGVTQLKQNVGSVRNKGIEISINSINFQRQDFSWTTNLNFSANKNEILDLYGDKQDDVGNKLFIGSPVTVSYDYKMLGVWQLGEETEALKYGSKPGYIKVYDLDESGSITPEKDRVILGNPFPNWIGGITNTFTYKDFDFSFFIYTRQGEFVKSGFHNDIAKIWDTRYNIPNYSYWTPTNPSNDYPSPGAPTTYGDQYCYQDVSFWRVGHITLGYEFNQKAIKSAGFSNLRVYLQVLNPFVITKYKGWDPEWASKGTGEAPLNGVTYMLGVNVSL